MPRTARLVSLFVIASVAGCGRAGPAALPGPAAINAVDADGETPLMAAVRARNMSRVKQLLAAGADPDVAGSGGQTALMLASPAPGQEGLDLSEVLIGASKNLDKADVRGMTALMTFAAQGRPDMAEALVDAGASVAAVDEKGQTPLFIASAYGLDAGLVKRLLKAEAGARAAGKTVPKANADGETPLMAASANGNVPVIRALVTGGSDLEARNSYGKTALYRAADLGHPDAIRALAAAGAKVDAVDNDGVTALEAYAGSFGREDAIRALLDAGADPARKSKGPTAIERAEFQNQPEKLDILQKAAATRPGHADAK